MSRLSAAGRGYDPPSSRVVEGSYGGNDNKRNGSGANRNNDMNNQAQHHHHGTGSGSGHHSTPYGGNGLYDHLRFRHNLDGQLSWYHSDHIISPLLAGFSSIIVTNASAASAARTTTSTSTSSANGDFTFTPPSLRVDQSAKLWFALTKKSSRAPVAPGQASPIVAASRPLPSSSSSSRTASAISFMSSSSSTTNNNNNMVWSQSSNGQTSSSSGSMKLSSSSSVAAAPVIPVRSSSPIVHASSSSSSMASSRGNNRNGSMAGNGNHGNDNDNSTPLIDLTDNNTSPSSLPNPRSSSGASSTSSSPVPFSPFHKTSPPSSSSNMRASSSSSTGAALSSSMSIRSLDSYNDNNNGNNNDNGNDINDDPVQTYDDDPPFATLRPMTMAAAGGISATKPSNTSNYRSSSSSTPIVRAIDRGGVVDFTATPSSSSSSSLSMAASQSSSYYSSDLDDNDWDSVADSSSSSARSSVNVRNNNNKNNNNSSSSSSTPSSSSSSMYGGDVLDDYWQDSDYPPSSSVTPMTSSSPSPRSSSSSSSSTSSYAPRSNGNDTSSSSTYVSPPSSSSDYTSVSSSYGGGAAAASSTSGYNSNYDPRYDGSQGAPGGARWSSSHGNGSSVTGSPPSNSNSNGNGIIPLGGIPGSTKMVTGGITRLLAGTEWAARTFPWTKQLFEKNKQTFGNNSFRHNQREVINATLSGRDCFVLMPTGGGKSLCYQLPAALTSYRRGTTVVFSPLISLIQDQCAQLSALDIPNGALNAATTPEEYRSITQDCRNGVLSLLYITPEKLGQSAAFMTLLENMHSKGFLAAFIIDEAHCVSQWGHDFRKDYLQLKTLKQHFKSVPIMALTATATDFVQSNVVQCLGIQNCVIFKQSFNRTNLTYEVRAKRGVLTEIVSLINERWHDKCGIIYCNSKKDCDSVAAQLRKDHGLNASAYHAGLSMDERQQVQWDWSNDVVKIMVATVAFGMGINKPDVRFVYHYTMPKSLEGYYQESGRAGRDGRPAQCAIFYTYADKTRVEWLIKNGGKEDQSGRKEQRSWELIQADMKKLYEVVAYCENDCDCRRMLTLKYFGELFDRADCKRSCDNCERHVKSPAPPPVDVTDEFKTIVNIVHEMQQQNMDTKPTSVADVYAGSDNQAVRRLSLNTIHGYGAGKKRKFTKTDIQRMLHQLLHDGILMEHTETTGMGPTGFPIVQHKLLSGANESKFMSSSQRVMMQFRKKTAKPKEKAPAKRGRKLAVTATDGDDDIKERKSPASSGGNAWKQTKIRAATVDEFDEDQDTMLQPLRVDTSLLMHTGDSEEQPEFVVIDGDEPAAAAAAAASTANSSRGKEKERKQKPRISADQVDTLSDWLSTARTNATKEETAKKKDFVMNPFWKLSDVEPIAQRVPITLEELCDVPGIGQRGSKIAKWVLPITRKWIIDNHIELSPELSASLYAPMIPPVGTRGAPIRLSQPDHTSGSSNGGNDAVAAATAAAAARANARPMGSALEVTGISRPSLSASSLSSATYQPTISPFFRGAIPPAKQGGIKRPSTGAPPVPRTDDDDFHVSIGSSTSGSPPIGTGRLGGGAAAAGASSTAAFKRNRPNSSALD